MFKPDKHDRNEGTTIEDVVSKVAAIIQHHAENADKAIPKAERKHKVKVERKH